MQNGDIILTLNAKSKSYNIDIITGDCCFDAAAEEHFKHSRQVKWLPNIISRECMPQYMIYSLGAYRTIFSLKNEDEFMNILSQLGISL